MRHPHLRSPGPSQAYENNNPSRLLHLQLLLCSAPRSAGHLHRPGDQGASATGCRRGFRLVVEWRHHCRSGRRSFRLAGCCCCRRCRRKCQVALRTLESWYLRARRTAQLEPQHGGPTTFLATREQGRRDHGTVRRGIRDLAPGPKDPLGWRSAGEQWLAGRRGIRQFLPEAAGPDGWLAAGWRDRRSVASLRVAGSGRHLGRYRVPGL